MRLPINSNQEQPRPYLTPFSYNTSITDDDDVPKTHRASKTKPCHFSSVTSLRTRLNVLTVRCSVVLYCYRYECVGVTRTSSLRRLSTLSSS